MQIITIYIIIIIGYALWKRVDAYQAFLEGVDHSFESIRKIFPNIMAIIFAIQIFTNSGILDIFETYLSNCFIHPKILLQGILKPISWSSSLLMMTNIFEYEGVNSSLGYLSTLIQGSSDTTIYVTALYFSSINIKRTGHTLIVGLLTDFLTFCFVLIIYHFLL